MRGVVECYDWRLQYCPYGMVLYNVYRVKYRNETLPGGHQIESFRSILSLRIKFAHHWVILTGPLKSLHKFFSYDGGIIGRKGRATWCNKVTFIFWFRYGGLFSENPAIVGASPPIPVPRVNRKASTKIQPSITLNKDYLLLFSFSNFYLNFFILFQGWIAWTAMKYRGTKQNNLIDKWFNCC